MSVVNAGQTYWTKEESLRWLKESKGIAISEQTFRIACKKNGVKGRPATGHGRSLFFSPQDIDRIPVSIIEEASCQSRLTIRPTFVGQKPYNT